MISENGAMVLDATLLDEQDLRKRTLVAPMSQVEVQEVGAIPVFGGAREVNRSKQPPENERRKKHHRAHLPQVLRCTMCCRARAIDDPHPAAIRDENFDARPIIDCDYAEIKMKRDSTPLQVISSCRWSVNCTR